MQRPNIQITSGAERLPSNSGQRRPGRPDMAQPPKALQAGARSNSGDGLQARRSSQGASLTEQSGRVWLGTQATCLAAVVWQGHNTSGDALQSTSDSIGHKAIALQLILAAAAGLELLNICAR